jgi:hypothetical protein
MYVENFSKLGEDLRPGPRAPAVAKEATLDQREHCPRSSRRSLRSSTASFALRPCLYIPLRFPFVPPPCYHE